MRFLRGFKLICFLWDYWQLSRFFIGRNVDIFYWSWILKGRLFLELFYRLILEIFDLTWWQWDSFLNLMLGKAVIFLYILKVGFDGFGLRSGKIGNERLIRHWMLLLNDKFRFISDLWVILWIVRMFLHI